MDRWPIWVDLMAVAGGGAIGSVARYLVNLAGAHWFGPSQAFWSTLVVNLAGCAAIGCLGGWLSAGWQPTERQLLFLRVGILGGLTTFSSFGWECYLLATSGKTGNAFVYLIANLVGGLGLVAVGYWLCRQPLSS